MHLPGSDAILGVRTPRPPRARLLGEFLRWRQVELIQDPSVHILSLQRAGGVSATAGLPPPSPYPGVCPPRGSPWPGGA